MHVGHMRILRRHSQTRSLLLSIQLSGGFVVCFLGLNAGYWLRFHSFLRHIGVEPQNPNYYTYLPILFFGTLCMMGSFAYLELYDARLLLRPHRAVALIMRGVFFWFLLFLSASLILEFKPPISRMFVAFSCVTTLLAMIIWRYLFYFALSSSRWRQRIVQRVAFLGWSEEAVRVAEAISRDPGTAYEVCGIITPDNAKIEEQAPSIPILGALNDFEAVTRRHVVDIVVVADLSLKRDSLLDVAAECERLYIAFKIIPSFFQIFVSSLRMQTIAGVPILGVEAMAIHRMVNRLQKRLVDIVGSIVGLPSDTCRARGTALHNLQTPVHAGGRREVQRGTMGG